MISLLRHLVKVIKAPVLADVPEEVVGSLFQLEAEGFPILVMPIDFLQLARRSVLEAIPHCGALFQNKHIPHVVAMAS